MCWWIRRRLDTQLTTLAGNPVVFALEAATGDLVGKDGSTEVIRIHITGASLTNAATGEVSYTYSTTLSQPVKHASLDGQAGDNSENSALLSGVTFAVTDKDTDTTQGTLQRHDFRRRSERGCGRSDHAGGGHGDHVQRDRQ